MKRPALQNKQVVILRMAFRARKVHGTFEKRAPGWLHYLASLVIAYFIKELRIIVLSGIFTHNVFIK